ncbi:MAG: MFS transporter [Myxococcota bacterium]
MHEFPRKTVPIAGWIAWGVVSLFYLYEFLIRVAPSVMEPELQKSFHLSAAGLGASLAAYFYIYAPLQLLVGGFLDEWGTKRVLVPAIVLCLLGCFLEAYGTSPSLLVAARLLQGSGSAFAFVGALHTAAQWFPRQQLAMIAGLTTGLGMLGAIAGNAVVAEFVSAVGWKTSLKAAGLFGVLVAAAVFFLLPKRREPTHGDLERDGSPLARILGHLRVVVTNPQVWILGLIASCLYVSLSVFGGLWGVPYIQAATGVSVVDASQVISALYVGWLIGGPIFGRVSDRLGHRKPMLVGSLAMTVLSTLLLVIAPPSGTVGMIALLFFIGLSSSLQSLAFAAGLEVTSARAAATSVAVINMSTMVISGLLQPLVGMLLDQSAGSSGAIQSADFSEADFRFAMIVLPVTAFTGLIASFFLRETYQGQTVVEERTVIAEQI